VDTKIGLVSFSDDVTVFGDGVQEPQIIGGKYLDDYDYLVANACE
jgi:hypothetical protein